MVYHSLAVSTTRDWDRLACVCPGVSNRGVGPQWPPARSGALNTKVFLKEFHITSINPTLPINPTSINPPLTGRECSPSHQQKTGLKTYWAWPCPQAQDGQNFSLQPIKSLPTASPSHQETCTSLLFSSMRRQTEWKPQSQKTNPTDHMDDNLISF